VCGCLLVRAERDVVACHNAYDKAGLPLGLYLHVTIEDNCSDCHNAVCSQPGHTTLASFVRLSFWCCTAVSVVLSGR